MSEEDIIHGCQRYERNSQYALYEIYAPAMMDICFRYSKNKQDAREILLHGFKSLLDAFFRYAEENNVRQKKSEPLSLGEWVKSEIINAAIEHMHANKKEYFVSSTVSVRDSGKILSPEMTDEEIMKRTTRDILLKALQQLSPSYRAVYNLHEIDGYSHMQISKMLDISEYASKDNLEKAKFNLKKNIQQLVLKS